MVVQNQTWERHEATDFVLTFDEITDEDSETTPKGPKDLTDKVVRFALARTSGGQPITSSPVLSFSSDDASPRVTIPNPVDGDPHVLVSILHTDTLGLAPKPTDFYAELEVVESDGSVPVVVATGTLTLLPNVRNA